MPLFSFFKRFSKLFKTVPPVHKLGVSYSVWDGEEMLEFAIRSFDPKSITLMLCGKSCLGSARCAQMNLSLRWNG